MRFGGATMVLIGGILIYAVTEDVACVIAISTILAMILDNG